MSDIQTLRQEKRFSSVGLPNGFRFGYYVDHADVLIDLGGDTTKVLAIVNSNLAAHSTATEARDQFTTDLERVSGFAYKTKQVEGTGKNAGKTRTVADETPKDYVDRFRSDMKDKKHTFTPATDLGTIDSEKEIATDLQRLSHMHPHTPEDIQTFLQELADLRIYNLDARVTERQAKEKGLPDYATKGAIQIYAGNTDAGLDSAANWEKWQKKMKKETGTVLPERTGDEANDLKALAQAIVTHQNASKTYK